MIIKKTAQKNIQFVKFLVVGFISSLLNLFTFCILFYYMSTNELFSYSLGYIIGILLGFKLNKKWSFKNKENKWDKLLLKYFLVYTFNLFLGMIFFKAIDILFNIEEIIIQLLAIIITAFCNFFGLNFFVFK